MKNKLNKSYYRGVSAVKLVKTFWIIILVCLILYCKLHENDIGFLIGFMIINSMCLIYFISRMFYVLNNIKKINAEVTDYSRKLLFRHKKNIYIYFFATIILSCVMVYMKVKNNANLEIWYWYGLQLPMMYSDAVNLSCVTAFGKNEYCSGDYVIRYSGITNCTEILHKTTRVGKAVVVELFKYDKKIGYDKFFIDEYHQFRLKVFQKDR